MNNFEALDGVSDLLSQATRNSYDLELENYIYEVMKTLRDALYELEHYKKIEKELGIDLATLSKALRDGVYMKTKSGSIVFCERPKINRKTFVGIDGECERVVLEASGCLFFEDYGKEWALTKEELEK